MRKRSAETENRYLRREVKVRSAWIDTLKRVMDESNREVDERRRIGAMMSNLCFNGKDSLEISARTRETMRVCQEAWDGIKRQRSV
jgi:hypothetical protein